MTCRVCGADISMWEYHENAGRCISCTDPDDFDNDELGVDPEEEFE